LIDLYYIAASISSDLSRLHYQYNEIKILKDTPYTIEKINIPITENQKKNTWIAATLLLSESPPLLTHGHPLAN
jgi:hypothetical protein